MSLNPSYMLGPSLQEFFIDKSTGLPLSGGQVYFYSDVNRTTLKSIYTISNTAPDYGYVAIANPVTLTGVGTFSDDNGNDILPYYYPFDANGNVELYFIQVYDQFGRFQFSRSGFPNYIASGGSSSSESSVVNYVPNGQFVSHTNGIPISTTAYLTTNIDYTPVAQGGWYFARSHGSSATDAYAFDLFQNYTPTPQNSPRYALKLTRSTGSADTVCDVRLRFDDVNKFESATQNFFFQFTAKSLNGSALNNVGINVYNFYGTGSNNPTAPATFPIKNVTILPSETVIGVQISFGVNDNVTIGSDNNDYVEICINFNAGITSTFSVHVTDVVLTDYNNQDSVNFPVTTTAQFQSQTMAGGLPKPNPNGMDLYLPIISTPEGLTYDRSVIGTLLLTFETTPSTYSRYVQADGSTLLSSGSSTSGIPYTRLLNYFLNISPVSQVPKFGTGRQYLTAYNETASNPSFILIATNQPGVQTQPLTGTTGFGSETVALGSTTGYEASMNGVNTLVAIGNFIASSYTSATSNAAGVTVSEIRNLPGLTYYSFSVTMTAIPPNGSYITFPGPSSPIVVWFSTSEVGTPPNIPGATLINCNFHMLTVLADAINHLRETICGHAACIIGITAGNSIPSGSYLTIYANSQAYVVWANLNGIGTQPSVSGAIYIPFVYSTTATAAQVLASIQLAINSYSFALPNTQGLIPRFFQGTNPSLIYDQSYLSRLGQLEGPGYMYGNIPGSFDFDDILNHYHITDGTPSGYFASTNDDTHPALMKQGPTSSSGGPESKPKTVYINAFIHL